MGKSSNAYDAEMPARPSRYLVLLVCWLATLAAAGVPDIVWYALLHRTDFSIWIPASQLIVFIIAFGVTFASQAVKSARGFLSALLAFTAGDWASFGIQSTSWWVGLVGSMTAQDQMIARTLLSLIPVLFMTLTLIGSGIGRRQLFLSRGNLGARAGMPFGLRSIRWTILGPVLIVIFVVPLAVQLTLTVHPDFSSAARAVRALPIILAFAVLNAASEEFRFRSVFIARMQPVVGTGHTLLLTSALFGLAHWFGHPSGPSGVLLAGIAGWFWGKSMIETRGFTWAWLIHAVQDVVIVAFVVMSRG